VLAQFGAFVVDRRATIGQQFVPATAKVIEEGAGSGGGSSTLVGITNAVGREIKEVEIKWFIAEFDNIAALVGQYGDAQQLVFKDDGL